MEGLWFKTRQLKFSAQIINSFSKVPPNKNKNYAKMVKVYICKTIGTGEIFFIFLNL
jgi:hypothetical protein